MRARKKRNAESLWIAGRRRFITIFSLDFLDLFVVVDCGQAQVYYNNPFIRPFLILVVDCGQAQVYYNRRRQCDDLREVVDCGQAQVYYN